MSNAAMSIDLISVNTSTTDGIFSDFIDEDRTKELNDVLEEIDAWLYDEATEFPQGLPPEIKEECDYLKERNIFLRVRGSSLSLTHQSIVNDEECTLNDPNSELEESIYFEPIESDWVDINQRPISPYFFYPFNGTTCLVPLNPIKRSNKEEDEEESDCSVELIVQGVHLPVIWFPPTPESLCTQQIQDWLEGFSTIRWKDIAEELQWLLNQRPKEHCVWICIQEHVLDHLEPDLSDPPFSYKIRLSTICQSLRSSSNSPTTIIDHLPPSTFLLACHPPYCFFYPNQVQITWEDVYFLFLSTPWTLASWPPFSTFDEDIWIESDSTEARIPQLVNEIVMRISEDVFMDIYATFHPSPTPALPPLAMIPPTLSTLITVKPALLHAKPCKPYKPRPRPFSSRPLLPIPVVVETFSPPSMSSKPFLFHPFLPPLSAPHSTRPCSSRRFPSSAARPTEVDVFERVTSARTGRKIPSLYHHY